VDSYEAGRATLARVAERTSIRIALAFALALVAAVVLATLTAAPQPARGWDVVAGPDEGLSGLVVTIDPGHNGRNGAHPGQINQQVGIGNGETKECDTTGTETGSGYSEAAYNLDVAQKLRRLLKRVGAKVVMTRDDNRGVGPCIDERAKIGNEAKSDAAVSIHADGGPPSGRGYHVIYSTRIGGLTDDIYRPSKRLAIDLRDAFGRVTGLPRSTYAGQNGLDERPDLGGLRLSDVPKVFIETGNMRNGADATRLESKRFRAKIARGIFAGLERFLLSDG
jgi:N-acetylmuramoyl-L-alanine amidase